MEKKKVLLVDDEAQTRELIGRSLERKGYQVAALENGLLGLNILSKDDFDILVSDINMPYMDGIEFTRRAKKLHPFLKIILLTGYGSLETAQQAIKIGIHEYLTKPVELEKLHKSIEGALQHSAKTKADPEYHHKLAKALEEEKERLDSLQKEIITIINHELRTPLAVISESFNSLKDKLNIPSDEKIKAMSEQEKQYLVSAFEKGRRRLINVIEDLSYYMDLSRDKHHLPPPETVMLCLDFPFQPLCAAY